MEKINTSHELDNLLLKYDIIIIDVYKTIENRFGFIGNVEERIKSLKANNKKVIIFSNYPFADYTPLLGCETYTSANLCLSYIKKQNLKKYFLFGYRKIKDFEKVNKLQDADFIYLDIPVMEKDFVEQQYAIAHPESKKLFFSKDIKGFEKLINDINNLDVPVFCPRPVVEEHHIVGGKKAISFKSVISSINRKALEIGKPYMEAYSQILNDDDKDKKVLCIGDTMQTDILGAINLCGAGYKAQSLLVLSGETKIEDINQYDYKPDYVVENLGI